MPPLRLLAVALLLAACNLPATTPETPTRRPAQAWQRVEDGLEWRELLPDGDELAQIFALRIDPSRYRFRVLYRLGEPLSLAAWRELESGAALIVNANFFDEKHEVLGALVSDGEWHGSAYRDYGGSFVLRDGLAEVRANRGSFPQRDNGIEQLAQGFPMLVEDGDPAYARWADDKRHRRTIIAQDASGKILILVAPFFGLSLPDLAEYLTGAELNIVNALNLDGGGSTLIALPALNYFQPSLDAVPAILAVYPR